MLRMKVATVDLPTGRQVLEHLNLWAEAFTGPAGMGKLLWFFGPWKTLYLLIKIPALYSESILKEVTSWNISVWHVIVFTTRKRRECLLILFRKIGNVRSAEFLKVPLCLLKRPLRHKEPLACLGPSFNRRGFSTIQPYYLIIG